MLLFMAAVVSGRRYYAPAERRDPKIENIVQQNRAFEALAVTLMHWLPVVFAAAVLALWLLSRGGKAGTDSSAGARKD